MVEAIIRLEPPTSLTPEVRAWISQRAGVTLSRGRDESGRTALYLRVLIMGALEDGADDQIGDLLTDLRLLGLRPTLLSAQPAPPPHPLDAPSEPTAKADSAPGAA